MIRYFLGVASGAAATALVILAGLSVTHGALAVIAVAAASAAGERAALARLKAARQ